ncbi:MAG: DNA-directed RNA polymerase subunit omega [Clostridia bacterium]
MLYPSIKELTSNHQSTYSLVIATSKIARKLSEVAEQEGYPITENCVSTAVHKIASGKVMYKEKTKYQ